MLQKYSIYNICLLLIHDISTSTFVKVGYLS